MYAPNWLAVVSVLSAHSLYGWDGARESVRPDMVLHKQVRAGSDGLRGGGCALHQEPLRFWGVGVTGTIARKRFKSTVLVWG